MFAAGCDPHEIARQAELAQVDWRDVLVNAGLENENWPAVLDQQLGGSPSGTAAMSASIRRVCRVLPPQVTLAHGALCARGARFAAHDAGYFSASGFLR